MFPITKFWITRIWNKDGCKYGNKLKVEIYVHIIHKDENQKKVHMTLMHPLILYQWGGTSTLAIKQHFGKYS